MNNTFLCILVVG